MIEELKSWSTNKYTQVLNFYGKTVSIITTQYHSLGESSDRIEISSSTCTIDLKNCVTKDRYRSNAMQELLKQSILIYTILACSACFGNFAFRYLGSDIPTDRSCISAREITAYFWQFFDQFLRWVTLIIINIPSLQIDILELPMITIILRITLMDFIAKF